MSVAVSVCLWFPRHKSGGPVNPFSGHLLNHHTPFFCRSPIRHSAFRCLHLCQEYRIKPLVPGVWFFAAVLGVFGTPLVREIPPSANFLTVPILKDFCSPCLFPFLFSRSAGFEACFSRVLCSVAYGMSLFNRVVTP